MLKIRFLFILALVTLATSGCRTDPASKRSSEIDSQIAQEQPNTTYPSTQSSASAPDSARDRRPIIVCFGDSLTAGFGADPGESYPDYLESSLDARGFHYRVINQGVSGNTTKDGLERVDRVLALHPAIVIVEFGGNDGLRGLPIQDSRGNLDRILTTLKASGTKIILAGITLPPDYGADYIQQFNATYTLLAKKHQVPILPFLLQGVYGVSGMMQADRTHATSAGNKIVADNLLPYVLRLSKK